MRVRGIITAAVIAAAGLVITATPAHACGDRGNKCEDGGAAATSADGGVTIRVYGTGVNAGSPGQFAIPASSVTVLPPCRFMSLWTGKEYYEGVKDQSINGAGSREKWEPSPGYEKYKNDTKGHWWVPFCTTEDYEGTMEEWSKLGDEWFRTQEPTYVEQGETPPVPPIPPEVLMEAAQNAMNVPEPRIDWSPKIQGSAASLVNMDTWVWLDDSPRQLDVTAEAGGNSATVSAHVDTMTATAGTASSGPCAGIGVPWSKSAADGCTISFNRADDATPVTVTTNWDVSWTYNGAPQGDLAGIPMDGITPVPVVESQAEVTGVN